MIHGIPASLWPLRLRERRSKGFFQRSLAGGSRPLARALLNAKKLHSVERGFVDRAGFRARLERLCSRLDCNEPQLRQIILLELWLRHRAEDERLEQVLRAA